MHYRPVHTKSTLPFLLIVLLLTVFSCDTHRRSKFTEAERHAADSMVRSAQDIPTLDSLLGMVRKQGDQLGEIMVLKEKGKRLRNESRFAEALSAHTEGLKVAELEGDTLEWVQALNNLGTDYRRMGILDMAQRYHYAAWMMSKECSDTAFTAKKNRVVSLNGLANVYMTTNNLERADSVLRMALAGETALGSLTGQAINCANLGAIFEKRDMTDSAWVYYRQSMALNRRDSNLLGMALCHTYFGDLYRKSHDYTHALAEYDQAYAIMKDSHDEWHALNSLTALARIHELMGNREKAMSYLEQSLRMARSIGSTEHLAEVYRIYYEIYKKHGDYRAALRCHEQARTLEDSLVNMDKLNRMQNTTLDMERKEQELRMAEARDKLDEEHTLRRVGCAVFVVIVLLMGSLIGMLFHARKVRMKSHKALKRLNEVRETFFTHITHEFRTPLTVILGLANDLQQTVTSNDEARSMGRTIERQGQCMLRLINQLLDISKIKSETGRPDWRRGNVAAYVEMIVEAYAVYADRQGIELKFTSTGTQMDTDFVPDYLHKAVGNLLSNALKFTDRGGLVCVDLRSERNLLLIDVTDTGCGIPESCLPHIFEEFYQADSQGGRTGTGIGLALVQQIVQSLGGSISVDSIVGRGTAFHIALPMRHMEPAAPALERGAIHEGCNLPCTTSDGLHPADEDAALAASGNDMPEARRVLVVEDNADIAAFIGKRLEGEYAVGYAPDGRLGLEKARCWMPDIIITDLMMPTMDGVELCRRVRGDELTCHIPIIVVTAKATEAERVEGLKAGADAYLVKPFNTDELTTRVEMLLEQRDMLRKRLAKELGKAFAPQAGAQMEKPAAELMSEPDRRFLNKLTDCVYLMLNAHKNVDVEAVASRLCMSYGQLNRKLNALTGYTPAQYIQRIKVRKAQRMLLAHPELDFNSIAEQCGFSDYSNFVRAFRKVLDMTPTQFVRHEEERKYR